MCKNKSDKNKPDSCESDCQCKTDVELKQFFCRTGSKRPIVKQLLMKIPDHKIYVEPFVGGGSLFWAKPSSQKSIINDLDKDLIAGYKLMKQFSKNEKTENFPIQKTLKSIQALVDKPYPDKYERLLGYLYQSCNTFGNTGQGLIYKNNTQINKLSKISEYISKIKKTVILSEDYKSVVKKYDSQESFFFLDPPYENSKGLYKEFDMDYDEMAHLLYEIDGKFMLTINDSPKIRKTFRNFNIEKIRVPAGGHSSASIGGRDRNELIITNYILD